jgi:RNA polymerase sigma-70 factor (ECF subfamily)
MVREDPDEQDTHVADRNGHRVTDFDEVYREHFHYVWRTLHRLGVATPDLEDVAHEVFVVVHRRLAEFDWHRPIKPWLFGIAFRLASEDRRRAHRRFELAIPIDSPSNAPRADDLMESDDRRRLVLECLQTLDVDQRAVLILLDIDGETGADVSSAMNIPLQTVYSRLRVARCKFAAAVRRAKLCRGEP